MNRMVYYVNCIILLLDGLVYVYELEPLPVSPSLRGK